MTNAAVRPVLTGDGFISDVGDDGAGIDWANNSVVVVGGDLETSRVGALRSVLAGFAGHAEIHIADGGSSGDWDVLRPICRTFDNSSGGDDSALNGLLESMLRILRHRAMDMQESFGVVNFWHIPAATREAAGLYPVVVVIDAPESWFGHPRSGGGAGKSVVENVRQLGQRGRSQGIVVVLTTSAASGLSLPIGIRDNAGVKIAFRVDSVEQGRTILGGFGEAGSTAAEIPADANDLCVVDVEGEGVQMVEWAVAGEADVASALGGQAPVASQFERAFGYALDVAVESFCAGVVPPQPEVRQPA